jgi:hypothetical protein
MNCVFMYLRSHPDARGLMTYIRSTFHIDLDIKGTVPRDFRPSFFHLNIRPGLRRYYNFLKCMTPHAQ